MMNSNFKVFSIAHIVNDCYEGVATQLNTTRKMCNCVYTNNLMLLLKLNVKDKFV